MTLGFDDYEIDTERRELTRAKIAVHVEPQVFDLLVYLIQNCDRVVSKDDLIASVWGGRIVSDSTLTSRINAARTAVGDSGEDQKRIPTIARMGFRFVGTLRKKSNDDAAAEVQASIAAQDCPLPDRPAIAVASLQQHERRSRTGVLFRRDQRGHYHRTVQASLALRHRPAILRSATKARPSI